MKLHLRDARRHHINVSIDELALSYGLRLPVLPTLVYENDAEFLASLEEDTDDNAPA